MLLLTFVAFVLLSFELHPTLVQAFQSRKTADTTYRRHVFWAGGQYSYNATTNSTLLLNQQYVEELTPLSGVKHINPIVFIHGGAISGTQWLNKPDGDPGWASYFLKLGYLVYIIDIWSVGRSSAEQLPPLFPGSTVESAQLGFTAPELYNKYYQARFHTQWPGNGTRGDPSFDAFYSALMPLNFSPLQENTTRASTCALLSQLSAPAILISHSIGGSVGFLTTDGCPSRVKAHVAVEADQPAFAIDDGATNGLNETVPGRAYGIADVPVAYDPPIGSAEDLKTVVVGETEYTDGLISRYPCTLQRNGTVRALANIRQAPILFLTGEASVHAVFDHCSVEYLRQAEVRVTYVILKEMGIRGNGHFDMLEKNSDDIAGVIAEYLAGLK